MIQLNNISYCYPGRSTPVLDSFDLHVNAGDFLVITGGNGRGKSTLLRLLAGIIPKFTGGIFTGDRYLEGSAYDSIDSARFGVQFHGIEQQFIQSRVDQEFLYLLENRELTKEEIDSRWEFIQEQFQIQHLASREIQTLSSGETQLIKLALAFALLPRILLLDEPLSHLDEPTKVKVINVFKFMRQKLGMTFIVADHEKDIWKKMVSNVNYLDFSSQENPEIISSVQREKRPVGNQILEMKDIHLSYGSRKILDGFNGKISRGECTVITGPNGAGKTTLLRLMMGSLKVTSGVMHKDQECRVRMLANPVFLNFFSQKVKDEYELEMDSSKSETFNTDDWVNHYVHDLSQGEQRKVAYNLLQRGQANLILLDEPFLHLDQSSRKKMLLSIMDLIESGVSVVITAHDVDFLKPLANQVWELSL